MVTEGRERWNGRSRKTRNKKNENGEMAIKIKMRRTRYEGARKEKRKCYSGCLKSQERETSKNVCSTARKQDGVEREEEKKQ